MEIPLCINSADLNLSSYRNGSREGGRSNYMLPTDARKRQQSSINTADTTDFTGSVTDLRLEYLLPASATVHLSPPPRTYQHGNEAFAGMAYTELEDAQLPEVFTPNERLPYDIHRYCSVANCKVPQRCPSAAGRPQPCYPGIYDEEGAGATPHSAPNSGFRRSRISLSRRRHHSRSSYALVCLVPSFAVIATIPAALTFAFKPYGKGTSTSAEFYELLANFIVQLLGLFIVLLPFLSHQYVCDTELIYVWLLGAVSCIGTVGALPVFFVVAQNWACILLLLGGVAQTLIVLQLIVGVVY